MSNGRDAQFLHFARGQGRDQDLLGRGDATDRSGCGRPCLPAPPRPPRGPPTMASREAVGGGPVLARSRPRARSRGLARRANARRDRADLRAVESDFAGSEREAARPRARSARLRSRNRGACDGDHRVALARAVLRILDDRLGQSDRDRSRRARSRILARRAPGRPAAAGHASRGNRPRRRGLRGRDPVRRGAVPRPHRRGAGRRLRGSRDRELHRGAVALRATGRAARDGVAVRDPARRVDHRDRGCRRRAALRALDCGVAASGPSCRR